MLLVINLELLTESGSEVLLDLGSEVLLDLKNEITTIGELAMQRLM